ncbi:hypothetical protein [Comamonas aquatica]|uniref:hypothetical protein n=1 Tax=Comamonas aquatica TaxID=225991 RepID=UPI0004B68952|nr:hypothetical protein [Comamonas aquatica]
MWSALVNRREVFEVFLGSIKAIELRIRQSSKLILESGSDVLLVWESDPTLRPIFPILVVVAEEDIKNTLSAIAASPQSPSPVTALSRFLTPNEAKRHFDDEPLEFDERIFPALTALAFSEAVLHGDGRIGIKQLSPLLCRRTLSFAWGKTVASRVDGDFLLELPSRWLEIYSILNSSSTNAVAQHVVDSFVGILSVLTQVGLGYRPETAAGALAYELLNGNGDAQERAWEILGSKLTRFIKIEALQSLAREERGSYLQDALRMMSVGSAGEQFELAAACAFLATRLAPGSLEHLEILRSHKRPDLLAWYGLFAALQNPREILSLYGGLGFRLSRDMLQVEDKLSPPSADIAYSELRMLARGNLESLVGRIGHSSELQVELIPYVSTSFTFQTKNRIKRPDSQQSLDVELPEPELSTRARLAQMARELSYIANELTENREDYFFSRKTRKRT